MLVLYNDRISLSFLQVVVLSTSMSKKHSGSTSSTRITSPWVEKNCIIYLSTVHNQCMVYFFFGHIQWEIQDKNRWIFTHWRNSNSEVVNKIWTSDRSFACNAYPDLIPARPVIDDYHRPSLKTHFLFFKALACISSRLNEYPSPRTSL